jgi:hypothetical protein
MLPTLWMVHHLHRKNVAQCFVTLSKLHGHWSHTFIDLQRFVNFKTHPFHCLNTLICCLHYMNGVLHCCMQSFLQYFVAGMFLKIITCHVILMKFQDVEILKIANLLEKPSIWCSHFNVNYVVRWRYVKYFVTGIFFENGHLSCKIIELWRFAFGQKYSIYCFNSVKICCLPFNWCALLSTTVGVELRPPPSASRWTLTASEVSPQIITKFLAKNTRHIITESTGTKSGTN